MAEGRGERTIGSGHLVALFLGIVVLCCVFFILGYEMGRAQYEHGGASASAARTGGPAPSAAPAAPAPSPAKPETPAPGWPSASTPGTAAGSKPAAAPAPAAGTTAAAAHPATPHPAPAASLKAPEIPRGALVLQVAANKNESDALGLAKILQEKGFPAFVLTPSGEADPWYRVQVGPYADAKSAEQAKAALAKAGFNKTIVKR